MRFHGLMVVASLFGVSGCSTPGPVSPPQAARQWVTLYQEDLSRASLPQAKWVKDEYPDDGIHSDNGEFFRKRGIHPPVAYRASAPFGDQGWLTFESYSRSNKTRIADLVSIQADPNGKGGKALRVVSPKHTDATVIRPSKPLPAEYRVCVEVGYADFGNGKAGEDNLNGYLGLEKSEPWTQYIARRENGFYWLTILDSLPRPHNNVWIHHHRKVVIDSDNNKDAWTNIWDGKTFRPSGEHPVMMFALSKDGLDHEFVGKPFISLSGGAWQPVGEIRAADAYEDKAWYEACVQHDAAEFRLSARSLEGGRFKFGGDTRYEGGIEASRVYQADARPEYFMFGDPHNNFYRGTVYYRNIRLEVPKQ
jgi:hypothetical protein